MYYLATALELDGAAVSDVSHRYLWGIAAEMLLADEQVASVQTEGNTHWPLAGHLEGQ